ncbi:hypothetical protein GCM10009792_04390 [Microcella alkalica]|uniref:Uncharacterized protein n=1 Tax=Microcella alkalica TaxID=355930 RepID=A0A839E8A8_9MICO|nr:hypothetical protein [Microcella alkalica]MBA8848761.1 hypothetical protein [Microcella alkalica]
MGRGILTEVGSILGITIVLALVGLSIVTAGDATTPGDIVPNAARFLFGATGIAIGLWMLLLIAGAVVLRHRPVGVRIGVHLLSAVIAVGLNTGLLALVAGPADSGWSGLIIAIALGAGAVLLIAVIIAVLVTELLIVQPRRLERPESGRPARRAGAA